MPSSCSSGLHEVSAGCCFLVNLIKTGRRGSKAFSYNRTHSQSCSISSKDCKLTACGPRCVLSGPHNISTTRRLHIKNKTKLSSVLAFLIKPQALAVSYKCFHRATEVLQVRRAPPHTSPLPEVTLCQSLSSALSHLAQQNVLIPTKPFIRKEL